MRISKLKHVFEKSYTPNYTTEVFTIYRIKNTALIIYRIKNTVSYLLKDYKDDPIKGCFYEQEMLKTKYPNDCLVEKISRKRSNKVLINWLGFDSSHNCWINKKDLSK